MRARHALGGELLGVYAGGSWALDDFVPGSSDLDVAVVTHGRPGADAIDDLLSAVDHAVLPCPARALELVLYSSEVAAGGTAEAGFELNLNTGAGTPGLVELHGTTSEPHWYALDRSLLAQRGRALWGPPAGDAFASAPRAMILLLLARSMDWHRDHADAQAAVLNACRALHFARTGRWASKSEAARWVLRQPEAGDLVQAALSTRQRHGGSSTAENRM